MDFGVIIEKDSDILFFRYSKTNNIYTILNRSKKYDIRSLQLTYLDYSVFDLDSYSKKKLKYWKNKFSFIENVSKITDSYQIKLELERLPKKYHKYIYYSD